MSERPNTAALLAEVRDVVRQYVVLPDEHFHSVLALWVLHTHAIAAADTTPRLVFKSAEKESGKTRVLEVAEMLVSEPLNTINATVPAIYRRLEEKPSTVLWDEVDAIFSVKAAKDHEDTRALINAGYRRGATVLRMVGVGTKMHSKEFPVFAAMALAAIGDLPDTIESRAIVVPMRRRAPNEQVKQFRRRWAVADTHNLRDSLAEWASVYVTELTDADPVMPEGITDRAADIWEPLLAIAELAGGEWPQLARAAAESIVAGRLAEDQSIGVRLLTDIRMVIGNGDQITSAALAEMLNHLEESSWGGWNDGKGINQRELARLLRRYLIAPKDIKVDSKVLKGYKLSQFDEAFMRYLRDPSATERYLESSSKPLISSGSSSSSGTRERTSGGTGAHAFIPEISATSATKRPNRIQIPVADVADSLVVLVEPVFDSTYLEAVGADMDAEAVAMAEEFA